MQHTASTVQKLRETKMTFFKRNVNVNVNANTTVRRSSNETDAKSASADCPLPGNDYEYDANSVTGGGAVVGDGTLITVRDDDSDGGGGGGGDGGGGGRFAKRSFFRFPGRRSSNRSSRANEASVSSSRNDDLDDLHDEDLHDSDDEDDSDDDDGNRSGNYPCVHLSPPPPPKSSRQNSLFSLENSIAELVGDDADDGASVAPSIDKYGFVHDGPDDDDCGGRRPVADAVDLDVAIDMDGDRASVLTSNSSLRDAASSTTLSHAPSHHSHAASHRSGRGLRATALPAHQHHHQHLLRTKVTGVPKRRIHKNFARQGIADDARRKAWMAIPNVDEVVARNRGRYDLLVERAAAEILELTAKRERGAGGGTNGGDDDPLKRGRRRSALDEDPSRKIHSLDWWDTLERDLGRTFPKHLLFRHLKDFKGVGDRVRPDGSRAIHFGGDNAQLFRTGRDCLLDDATQQQQQQQQQPQDDDDNRSDAFEQVAKFAVESTGQAALRRLLRAYSTHDPQVGYCQGMNFIAALFLMVMDDEETAFWMFVSVMTEDVYNLRELFLRDMAGTQEVLYVAERLIQQFLPRLFEHFQQQNVQMSMILTPWLMTIYTRNFPFDLVLRVWDSFLVEGWKVVYRTMLALLEHAQPALLQLEFEEIVMYLREFTSGIDGPNIMLASLKISLRRKHILKYVAEWKGLSERGETRTVDTGVFNRLNTRGSEVVSSMGFGSFVDT